MDRSAGQNSNIKPSSEERLARWARALHTAQSTRPANERPKLDHYEFLRRIRHRTVSEDARGGGSLFLCRAIRREFGAESVEWRDTDEFVQAFIAERDHRGFLAKLRAEWDSDFVSLSGAVWWIVSQGGAKDWDDEHLEGAAKELLGALTSEELVSFGVSVGSGTSLPAPVPSHHFMKACSFFGDIPFELIFSEAAVLHWGLLAEKDWRSERGDIIEDRWKLYWKRLCVRRIDLQRKWPAAARTPHVEENERSTIDTLSIYRTGAPGRPSAIQFVERKWRERRDAGQALDSLSAEAKALNAWCAEKHLNIAAPAPGTIENRIRSEYNSWKSSQAQTARN
jgi:hypothetical protein